MKMPLGLAPQRSKVLPSLRVLTEEAKLQVPTRRLAIESGACAGSACAPPGIAAVELYRQGGSPHLVIVENRAAIADLYAQLDTLAEVDRGRQHLGARNL